MTSFYDLPKITVERDRNGVHAGGWKTGNFSRNRRKNYIESFFRAKRRHLDGLYGNCEGYSHQIINNYWMRLSMIGQSLWYLPKPKAEADNTVNWGLDNYRYYAKTESSNCFIMHIPELSSAMTKLIKLLVSVLGDVTSPCIKLLSVGMM